MDNQSNEVSYNIPVSNDLLLRNEEFVGQLNSQYDFEKDLFDSLDSLELMQASLSGSITVISQPRCTSSIRYRSDYTTLKRRNSLQGTVSTYKGPVVQIPPKYPDSNTYIGVSLSTVEYAKTQSRYVHPYVLESIDGKGENDTKNNIVWYRYSSPTRDNILNFPDLHIIRVDENELESSGNLRIIDNLNLFENQSHRIEVTKRKIKQEYKLSKGLLAFFVGKKQNANEQFPTIVPDTTVFSEEINLLSEETSNDDTASSLSPPSPTDCSISKYAPLFGFTDGGNEMIVICTKNLDKRRYGDVQVKFQSTTVNLDEMKPESVEIQGNIVFIKMPPLPSLVNGPLDVKIKFQQTKRDLGVIDYQYLLKNECHICQMNKTISPNLFARSNSNKRQRSYLQADMQYDGVVPVSERDRTLNLQHSRSEILSNRSSSNTDQPADAIKRIEESIHQLFQKNDLKPILRSSRLFIKQRPELFHQAIENNYSDLITTFVSVAGQQLLESKNDQGETPLLQGVRFNRVPFVRAFLQRENVNEFLYDVNEQQQNIFHLLAMNNNSDELFELIINHLNYNSVNIKEKFDCIDGDDRTPLQIAITNHNLSSVRRLIKYSDKEIIQTSDTLGENLIHFTVRFGDLTILKYLLENEDLIEQGQRSSLTMTPLELANFLKRDDMKNYLEKIYPQPKIGFEEETSDNN